MSAARTERLMNLLTLLLNAKKPVSVREIRGYDEFSAYSSADPKSGERAFERDKAALVGMGIPLRYVPGQVDDDDAGGYVIDRERYYLKALDLEPHQWAALMIAGSGALAIPSQPFRAALVRAMAKMGFDADEDAAIDYRLIHRPQFAGIAEGAVAQTLEVLLLAMAGGKRIELRYQVPGQPATERAFDVYGVFWRQGMWHAVGRCHLREAQRTLLVHRMAEVRWQNEHIRADFAPPRDFDLDAQAGRRHWNFSGQPKIEVDLWLEARLAPVMRATFGMGAALTPRDGGLRLRVDVDAIEPLLPVLLPHHRALRVESPPALAQALKGALERLARMHGGAR